MLQWHVLLLAQTIPWQCFTTGQLLDLVMPSRVRANTTITFSARYLIFTKKPPGRRPSKFCLQDFCISKHVGCRVLREH